MNRNWLRGAVIAAIVGIAIAAYFVNVEWQTRIGQQALDDTHLDFNPLADALAQSKAEGKPVLADFSAIWCPTCRAMHTQVFTDAAVKAAITNGYVLSRIDYESKEAPAFMQRYDVSGFPTLLVLDGDGKLLRKLAVSLDPKQFERELLQQ